MTAWPWLVGLHMWSATAMEGTQAEVMGAVNPSVTASVLASMAADRTAFAT